MDKLFLRPKDLQILTEIFDKYFPNAEIWAYVSKIDGTAHEGSDLDFVVKSFNDESKNIYALKQLISDSNIPILVDIHQYDKLPDYFKTEIERNYIIIYKH